MDDACDERNDPLHATRAAARKFKQDFQMLQTWPLTITGWNHGYGRRAAVLVEH